MKFLQWKIRWTTVLLLLVTVYTYTVWKENGCVFTELPSYELRFWLYPAVLLVWLGIFFSKFSSFIFHNEDDSAANDDAANGNTGTAATDDSE